MKKSFLRLNKPIFTTMIQTHLPETCFDTVERAKQKGTDAFGFQIEQLYREYRTESVYRDLFEERMGEKPCYVTSYRGGQNENLTDEQCMDELLFALKCGATLGDVIGNAFDRGSEEEITFNQKAIDEQKRLIDKIHAMGKEVLISSHIWKVLTPERILEVAYAQQARGADIAKIVGWAHTPDDEIEYLKAMTLLKKELKIPFLVLSAGENYRLLRLNAGCYFGNSLALCTESYDELATKAQPPVDKAKTAWQNVVYEE